MAFERITIDPGQMAGVPCIRGLRIPVATVVGLIAHGMTDEQILEEYPDLEFQDIREALRYDSETDMSQDHTRVTDQLREKIRSKMDVAKFFATFITLLIALLLGADGGLSIVSSKLGVVLLLGSAGFCIAAVFAYDSLLMPQKYWGESTKVMSESKFQDVLSEMMVKTWSWLFIPAVGLFGLGVVLSLVGPLELVTKGLDGVLNQISVSALLVVNIAAPLIVGFAKRPKTRD